MSAAYWAMSPKCTYRVTLSGPLFRITTEKLPSMITAVRVAAQKITDNLRATEY